MTFHLGYTTSDSPSIFSCIYKNSSNVYSNILPRSATFHQAVDETGMTVGGHLQRSETMPHSVAQQGEQEREKERLEISSLWSQNKDSVTSSLSSLGSSLKLSFG